MFKQITTFFQKTQPKTKIVYIIAATLIIASLAISMLARYHQLDVWKKNPDLFYATGTPMMTTLDAYKFLRHAKEHREKTFDTSVKDKMIFYPDDSPFPDPVPLLSVVLEKLSSISGNDLYISATYLMPVVSSLFIIPLALYFMFLGLPSVGILGGIIATFAPMFFLRSGMGRLDTDGGVLFFLFTASLFVLLAMKTSSKKKMFIFTGLLGLTVTAFYTWYHHGMFNLFYLAILIICLAIARYKVKDIAIACGIYLICANPVYTYYAFSQLAHAINVYIFNVKTGAAAIFPNVYNTIGEAQRDSFLTVLSSVTPNPLISIIGLLGALLLVIGFFKYMLPLMPVAALAAMPFISSGRFAMFLGPIIGAGLAYLCILLFSFVKFSSDARKKMFLTVAPFIAIILIALGINLSGNSAISVVVPPSITPPTYQAIKDIKNELPKNSAIYTWWDYGLAIADATGFPVFHSGMTQETPKTWIIAKSFISDEQMLYNIVSYLDNYGVAEIEYMAEDNATLEEIEKHIYTYNEGPSNNSDYVMITDDFTEKFSALAYLATWRKDKEPEPKLLFQKILCNTSDPLQMDCGGNAFNLQLGLINNKLPIKEAYFLLDGKIAETKTYNFQDGYYIIMTGRKSRDQLEAVILNKAAFESSFVQLYYLAKVDPNLFQLAFDRYPYARAFKVMKKEDTLK